MKHIAYMKQQFIPLWHQTRQRTQSNIIAGLDPALYHMGHGDNGLPNGIDLLTWSLAFVEAVTPYVVGIKINQAYFQGIGQRTNLQKIVKLIKEKNLLAISDNKIADIGSTNDAWIFYTKELGFDALTCAPYAGNLESNILSAHTYGLGMITMGLMSNPEYKDEMYFVDKVTGVELWRHRVERALTMGADGVVIGGTFNKEDRTFRECIDITRHSALLYLVPGIGSQGGTVESFLASGINPEKCLISSSRGVMFPNGSHSTPNEQGEAAKILRDTFNNLAYGKQ